MDEHEYNSDGYRSTGSYSSRSGSHYSSESHHRRSGSYHSSRSHHRASHHSTGSHYSSGGDNSYSSSQNSSGYGSNRMKGKDFLTQEQLQSIAGDLADARSKDDHDWENIRGGRPVATVTVDQPTSADGTEGNEKPVLSGNGSSNRSKSISENGIKISAESGKLTKSDNDSKKDRKSQKRREKAEKKAEKRRRKKGITPFKVLVAIFIIIIALLAAGVGTLVFLRYKGSKDLQQAVVQEEVAKPANVEEQDDGSILYNGQKYWYNSDLINILLLGIDKEASTSSDQSIGENGQADTLILASIDKTNGQMSLLNISREAMAEVTLYNTNGEYAGVETMQICLAYAYGDGHESSCKNVATSVSKLLYGIPINGYAAIDYSAISGLNDAVGGVTVQVLEDLSAKDPELTFGSWVTLKGDQAITYIRSRNTEELESNNSRMQRQKQYLTGFLQQTFSQIKTNPMLVTNLYGQASEKMVTDVGLSDVVYLTSLVAEHGFTEANMSSVPGTVVQGPVYAEYQVDKDALYDQIIQLFYTQTKN